MKLTRDGGIAIAAEAPENGHCPSVSQLFRSVAAAVGRDAVAVLLTGMGKDGAAELKLLKDAGAITIAQSEDSCAVPGMPGEAIRLGAATHVLPPERIGEMLVTLAAAAGTAAPRRSEAAD
jgi:two-component system chemotaxis response regulator CheB